MTTNIIAVRMYPYGTSEITVPKSYRFTKTPTHITEKLQFVESLCFGANHRQSDALKLKMVRIGPERSFRFQRQLNAPVKGFGCRVRNLGSRSCASYLRSCAFSSRNFGFPVYHIAGLFRLPDVCFRRPVQPMMVQSLRFRH